MATAGVAHVVGLLPLPPLLSLRCGAKMAKMTARSVAGIAGEAGGAAPLAIRLHGGSLSTGNRRNSDAMTVRVRYAAETDPPDEVTAAAAAAVEGRVERKRRERRAYLGAAVVSSLGITSAAVAAVYYRFYHQTEIGESVPLVEMLGTLSLTVGSIVGMELWARWAHRALWHASLWGMHESHHRPRQGALELNDAFAIINAVPAIALLAYGSFNRHLFGGLCFGAGLGITIFGMAYMFVHDGMVHRRFPVGPIANVPYLRRVAAAHHIHHSGKFNGVPYGLFMGPQELEEVGGLEELNREMKRGRGTTMAQ